MISRKFIGKFVICLSLFVVVFQNASAQEAPLTLNDILVKLTFTSRVDKTAAQINAALIEQINERKVGFELTADDEQKIKKRGGNPALIKAVKANFLETRSPEMIEQVKLYENFIACYPKTDLESRKLCLEIAKEFVKNRTSDSEVKAQIDYFKEYLLIAEKMIAEMIKKEELDKSINEFNACLPKEDLESRKSCLALGKELLKKPEMTQNIDSLKRTTQELEKMSKKP